MSRVEAIRRFGDSMLRAVKPGTRDGRNGRRVKVTASNDVESEVFDLATLRREAEVVYLFACESGHLDRRVE